MCRIDGSTEDDMREQEVLCYAVQFQFEINVPTLAIPYDIFKCASCIFAR